jgi:hypothetical protein
VEEKECEFFFKLQELGLFADGLHGIVAGDDLQLWEIAADLVEVLVVHAEDIERVVGFDADYFFAHELVLITTFDTQMYSIFRYADHHADQ